MASDLDTTQAAASVYAESLLQLATQAGKADAIADEVAQLQELWHKDAGFAAMMSSAAIDDDARNAMIRKAFANRVDPLVLNLMLVLNDKRRSSILPQVCKVFRKKVDRQAGREEVFVTTAVPLEAQHRTQIQSEVKRLTGFQPLLVERIDPDILGGIRIQVADRVYDMTVRRRLRELRTDLLEAGQKHMHSGTSRFMTNS